MRKTLLIVLPLLLISFSFSQEPINYDTTLIEKGQLYYTKDTNQPYSGPVFSLYENGKKKEEGSLKDGKMISKTKWKWYKNGQKWSEGNYKDGKVDGSFTFWYENGQKNYEENYKDGIKIGSGTGWYENGQKSFEITYRDGALDGSLTYWYENGQKYREMTYQDGELINERYWTEDGFNNGELIFYFNTGEIWKKGNLKDGKREGVFITYGYYGSQDIYHKRILQNYRDGKLDGESVNYFDTGDVNVVENYKDGKQEGNSTYYDKDGKIYWEGTYKDDVLVKEISYIGSKGPFRLN